MATSILGTFPILNFKKSQTDEYGFDYLSYQYTIKTSELATYNIKKDDVFTGIESWTGTSFAKSPSVSGSTYVVDSVETNNVEGGLTELTVNTIGTKNSIESNSPRIVLLSGGPLIFGLSGTAPSGNIYGYGIAGAGQSVEIKFLAKGGVTGQQEVFTTHFASAMPATFRGISLPAPARGIGYFNDLVYPPTFPPNPSIPSGYSGVYSGFVCKTILTEKRGSLLLVTLTFSEAGYADQHGTSSQNTPEIIRVYNFPRIG
jgi:hypothetical protein